MVLFRASLSRRLLPPHPPLITSKLTVVAETSYFLVQRTLNRAITYLAVTTVAVGADRREYDANSMVPRAVSKRRDATSLRPTDAVIQKSPRKIGSSPSRRRLPPLRPPSARPTNGDRVHAIYSTPIILQIIYLTTLGSS